MRKFFKITFVIAVVVIAAGYLIPERKAMPCCTPSDYNHQSFWHWPWTRGTNGHPHTGVDIFGKVGTPVVSQTGGIVIYAAEMPGKAASTPAHVHYESLPLFLMCGKPLAAQVHVIHQVDSTGG